MKFYRITHGSKSPCQQILRIMKLTVILLFGSLMAMSASTYSQNTKLNVSAKNSSLIDIFRTIEDQSEFYFYFKKEDVNSKGEVSADLKGALITEVLDQVLAQTGLEYKIIDRYVVVKEKGSADPVMLAQQERKITGKVTGPSGEPIPGATVAVKGTTTGVITTNDGSFSLSLPADAKTVAFSFIGMKSQEVVVGTQSVINVILQEETVYLDEVVAVGYGTQKKVNLTGAIETIAAKQLANRPATSMSQLLQGQAPSIVFTPGGNAPGKNPTMEIRGNAALSGTTPPLIVINGIPSSIEDFNALNPNDVEEISVLKDAAATAVYGARAPYGVLLVNTKVGSLNQTPSLSFSSNVVFSQLSRLPKPVNAYQYGVLVNQGMINEGDTPQFSDNDLFIMKDNIANPGKYSQYDLSVEDGYWRGGLGNHDYMKEAFGLGVHQVYNLAIRGGTSKTNYSFSAGYMGQQGNFIQLQKDDKYTRLNLNGVITTEINNWLKASYLTRFSRTLTVEPSFGGPSWYGTGLDAVYVFAMGSPPTYSPWNPDGAPGRGSRFLDNGNFQNKVSRYDNTIKLDANLAKGWTAHIDGTMRQTVTDYENQNLPSHEIEPGGFMYGGSTKNLIVYKNMLDDYYWTVQGYTQYLHKLGQHTLNLQLGGQVEEDKNIGLYGTGTNSMAIATHSIQVTQGTRSLNDHAGTWATAGFFGRFNYNYKEKYLLEFNGRYDGSGRFSQGKQWGFFPSASAGWILSKESFWKSIESVVDFAKLRASYGTVGNQGNAAGYVHIQTMNVYTQSNWPIGDARGPYVGVPGLINTNRTWEKYTTTNLGLDSRLLKNRLSLSYDYFNRRIWDLLGPPTPLPNVLGASPAQSNNATMMTKGWEAVVNWRDRIDSKWDYSIGFTLADATSHIVDYNNSGIRGLGRSAWYPGKEVGEVWGYKVNRLLNAGDFNSDGAIKIDQSKVSSYKFTPGDIKYEDLDGDSKVTPGNGTVDSHGDMVKLGNSNPHYRYSINLGSGYNFNNGGRLDLSVLFQGVGQWKKIMSSNYYYWGMGDQDYTIPPPYNDKISLNFYRDETSTPALLALYGENKNSLFPKPYMNYEGGKNFEPSNRYFVNTKYIRLKNVQLTYTLPKAWLPKSVINGCQVYFSGENLLLICPKLPRYIDPELPGLNDPGVNTGYPQQSMYTFGLNINF